MDHTLIDVEHAHYDRHDLRSAGAASVTLERLRERRLDWLQPIAVDTI